MEIFWLEISITCKFRDSHGDEVPSRGTLDLSHVIIQEIVNT